MLSPQPPTSSSLPSLSIPVLQTGPKTEHLASSCKHGWSIEFIRRSATIDRHLPSHSISFIAQRESAQWHIRATFLGEPSTPATGQKVYWPKRWHDFRALCRCMDFDSLSLLDDKFTELFITPKPDPPTSSQLLPLKGLPSSDSDYGTYRKASLWFNVREYHEHTCYPLYIGSGRTIHFRNIQRVQDINSCEHVNTARILGDERQYVYKGVDRLIYFPHDTKVLEQELRNLQLFHGSKRIVRLIAAVMSSSPYQTRESGASPPVLRGILLEYHPNGTLHDVLQSPEPWTHSPSWWLRWAFDISTALAYMHRMGVTHMDLKPKNVVMSKEWNAIIIDVSGIGGTTDEWLLPELFASSDRCSESWELRVQNDTWAFGKILALMVMAMNDGGKEEKRPLLFQIAQDIERTRGCISFSAISNRLSQVVASIDGLIDKK